MKNNVFSAAFFYIIGSFFVQGLRFITLPIFTGVLSTEEFGLLASYDVWVSFITIFIGLQTSSSIPNAYIDFGEENIKNYTTSLSALGFLTFIIISFVSFIMKGVLSGLFELSFYLLFIGIIQCLFTYFFNLLISVYRILEKPVLFLFFSIGNSLITTILSIIFVYCITIDRYIGKIYGMFLGSALIGIVSFIVLMKSCKKFINKSYLKFAIVISIPLIFHALASIILSKTDQIMLLKMQSSSIAGQYNYASNFGHIIYVLYTASNQAFVPWYYKNLNNKKSELVNIITKEYLKCFSILFMMFIYLLPELIKIMAPKEYYGAFYTAPLLSLSFYFNFVYTFSVNYEFYNKKTAFISIGTIISAITNVLFNLILIPVTGQIGAAIATVLSSLSLVFIHFYIAKKIIKNFEFDMHYLIKNILIVLFSLLLYFIFIKNLFIRGTVFIILLIYMLNNLNTIKNKKLLDKSS